MKRAYVLWTRGLPFDPVSAQIRSFVRVCSQ